ncbi:MAG TPA: lipoprotein [Steroidobacteraceae bacterium]|nr:lipoprotein [Steroidobacteraceae bacterium]
MRTLRLASLAALALAAACGQKGPLVLPQKSVATPVLIVAPATGAAAPAAAPPAAAPPAAAPTATSGQPPPAKRPDDEPEPSPPKH